MATTISTKVQNYKELTEKVRTHVYPILAENSPYVSCLRKTANDTIQVEFLERKPASSSNSERGLNLTFFINRGHDERFREFVNIKRAWATVTSMAALVQLLGKDVLSPEDIEALKALPEGSEDRLAVMKQLPTIEQNGEVYEMHIGVTEVRQIELDEGSVALNKSQMQALEHENTIKQTGGDNSELIVCGTTGSQIREITEVVVVKKGSDLSKIDQLITNKKLQSVYLATTKNETKITPSSVEDIADAFFS